MIFSYAFIVYSCNRILNLYLITCTYYPIVPLFFGWGHFPFSFIKKTSEACFSFKTISSSYILFISILLIRILFFIRILFIFIHTLFIRIFFICLLSTLILLICALFICILFIRILFIRILSIPILFIRIFFTHRILLRFIHTVSNNSGIVTRLPKTFSQVKIQINVNSSFKKKCMRWRQPFRASPKIGIHRK